MWGQSPTRLTSPPKFIRRQLVRVALYNEKGKPKNKLAAKSIKYCAQVGEVADWGMLNVKGVRKLAYRVKMDDGNILTLTEDCLMPVNDYRHGRDGTSAMSDNEASSGGTVLPSREVESSEMVARIFRSSNAKPEAGTPADIKTGGEKEVARPATEDYRSADRLALERELRNLLADEIHRAARELAEEQRKAIREAVEHHKQIIREVLEEEKARILVRAEEQRIPSLETV